MKAFADEKINITQELGFALGMAENIVGKGENGGYQHFLPFSTMFSKTFFLRIVKNWDCVVQS